MTPERIHRLETLDVFAGGVTHELNNALAAVIGFAELCMDEHTPDDLRENLDDILQSAERARDFVRQFQMFRSPGNGESKPFQARIVVKEAVKTLRAFMPPNIAIRHSIRGAGMLKADPVAFNRIVMGLGAVVYRLLGHRGGTLEIDLMDLKSMPSHSGEGVREIGDGYQFLSFRAAGERFDDAAIREMLAKREAENEGNNAPDFPEDLDRMARACGGLFLCEWRGANEIDLSVMLPSFAEPEKKTTEIESVDRSLRILFVEDDESAARTGKKTLERLGHQVEAHGRGASALASFRADPRRFDLLFTDLSMPEMNGDLLAKEILDLRPDLPVILYSGYMDQNLRGSLSAMGFNAVLSKPLNRGEIAEAIRKAVA